MSISESLFWHDLHTNNMNIALKCCNNEFPQYNSSFLMMRILNCIPFLYKISFFEKTPFESDGDRNHWLHSAVHVYYGWRKIREFLGETENLWTNRLKRALAHVDLA